MSRLAWGSLFFNLAVIVWGAFVRASGSGAGCGSHWPLCNGEIIPRAESVATLIEFTHRMTSGMCLILAAMIAVTGLRQYAKGSLVRRASVAVLGFTLMEALIGAGLVLLRYVEHDQSVGRAISICLHLTNTFLLLGSLALTAWWSTFAPNYRLASRATRSLKLFRVAVASLAATTILGVTGAMTALGDTLFRSTTLLGGLTQDFSEASHFLLRLRVLHPVLAVGAAALLFYFAELAQAHRTTDRKLERLATVQKFLVALQLGVGAVNLVLLAPTGLQLLHLAIAEGLWVTLVLTTAVSLQAQSARELGTSPLELDIGAGDTVPVPLPVSGLPPAEPLRADV